MARTKNDHCRKYRRIEFSRGYNGKKKKEKLLRKIHMKDYTNSLEKILEDKQFSVDTKNLLFKHGL